MTGREKELLTDAVRGLVVVLLFALMLGLAVESHPAPPPLGIRHNNPGNMVCKRPDKYVGAVGHDSFGYLIFKHPWYGIRAMSRQLVRYHRQGLRTPRQVATKWTGLSAGLELEQYIRVLCQNTGARPDRPMNLRDRSLRMNLMQGIVVAENGVQPYPDTMYRDAMRH